MCSLQFFWISFLDGNTRLITNKTKLLDETLTGTLELTR